MEIDELPNKELEIIDLCLSSKDIFNIPQSINVIYYINRMKGKIMFFPVDAENVFSKIQPPFIIKTSEKLFTEETYLNIIKAIMTSPQPISTQ